ncbi:putative collagen-binding domain-containing protein [Maribellus sp. YY47]|uniref:putative collagen-binding domain-containing protein n=1 Tax=Maribellus sp. YY47 TaxID=2929486 RepID=UPI002001CF94|nr:putative collagen-binding domain-containing protein [Maribellus sp. YY47]MCK3682806.1 hypothetical protein [Maribellus sp. YY47]
MKLQIIFLLILLNAFFVTAKNKDSKRIQPWTKNHWSWQFNKKPVMLLGASSDDNLFQWPANFLIPHLDSMTEIGANYVRNTMSDRQGKGFELYPYARLDNGKYDLNKWNDEYWQRFENFLKETHKRNIIVQIEVWDRFDYSRQYWTPHPYNPKNNINYTFEDSGLKGDYPDHPGRNVQPFFFTTLHQQNNEVLLKYQKQFVDKMLSYSLNYNHVLYCIDNETSAQEEWAVFWSEYILNKAKEAGKETCVTEMWDNWDLKSEHHKRTFDHPERYAFCDVSQNNQMKGQVHWDNFQWVRNYISKNPRPINTVKTYGADGGSFGGSGEALDRWWRHVLGGAAAARFHRPTSGLGLSKLSMNSVKTAREIEKAVKFWNLTPENELLSQREENEAYLACKKGEAYVVFFTDGGEVGLDLSNTDREFSLKWMNIRNGECTATETIKGGKVVHLQAPGKLEWIALLEKL